MELDQNQANIHELSLGRSVLEANEIDNGSPVITGNYIGPDHNLPLPWPEGDWYLRQAFVPAVGEKETVICHTLIPGLLNYYREIGLIPTSSRIIEVEPKTQSARFGFPGTDPLEILRGNVKFDDTQGINYLIPTFGGKKVDQQAHELGLRTLKRAESSQSNHKSRFRQAATEHGFTMLPGTILQTWEEIEPVINSSWNTKFGTWLKFPTGSGGDLVVKVDEITVPEDLRESVARLRNNVEKAFSEGQFDVSFSQFWPDELIAPEGYPLVLEADAQSVGEIIANGSTQFLARKVGEVSIIGHYKQITTQAGEYLGNEPFDGIGASATELAEDQATLVANYNVDEHGYFGIAAIDWFLTRDSEDRPMLSVVELNSRATANTPPVIIAQKLDVPHFINTNVYTGRNVHNIDDFVAIVGEDLAYGDPIENGMVVPQAFRTLVNREQKIASPNFKIAILGKGSDHCRTIMGALREKGLRFEP